MTAPAVFAVGTDAERRSPLWEQITPEFLELVRWSPQQQKVMFPQEHPIMGWRICTVVGCREREVNNGLCMCCATRWRRGGHPPLEQFCASQRARQTRPRDGLCAVKDCQRQVWSNSDGLCRSHQSRRLRLGLTPEQFLTHPGVVGLPAFGECEVVSCDYQRVGRGPYCHIHDQRWQHLKRTSRAAEIDEMHWRRTTTSSRVCGEVNMRGLPHAVVAELLFGLQQRVARCSQTPHTKFRLVCEAARKQQVTTLTEVTPESLATCSRKVLLCFLNSIRLAGLNPETERLKDEWDTAVFGYRGVLRFGAISQPWLREATKRWAYHDMSTRRGSGVKATCQGYVSAMGRLSESLRLHRDGSIGDL